MSDTWQGVRGEQGVPGFVLANRLGTRVEVSAYGGVIVSIHTADRTGQVADITLGYRALEAYRTNEPYFGALVGRYANRIADGRFVLDGTAHTLSVNQNGHTLHGGPVGFHQHVWAATPFKEADRVGVRLVHTSPEGDQGFPGRVTVEATYALTDENALEVAFEAWSDRATPLSLTQHTYVDLSAGQAENVLGHALTLGAEHYLPVDGRQIPTGVAASVAGTPFDFRQTRVLGSAMAQAHPQIDAAGGYDHAFVLTPDAHRAFAGVPWVGRLAEATSGRTLDLYTTQPTVQLYTGNHLGDVRTGHERRPYGPHAGVALETQQYPDAPNQPAFPSAILRPGEKRRARTIYRFGTDAP